MSASRVLCSPPPPHQTHTRPQLWGSPCDSSTAHTNTEHTSPRRPTQNPWVVLAGRSMMHIRLIPGAWAFRSSVRALAPTQGRCCWGALWVMNEHPGVLEDPGARSWGKAGLLQVTRITLAEAGLLLWLLWLLWCGPGAMVTMVRSRCYGYYGAVQVLWLLWCGPGAMVTMVRSRWRTSRTRSTRHTWCDQLNCKEDKHASDVDGRTQYRSTTEQTGLRNPNDAVYLSTCLSLSLYYHF